jgi:hypothetical protein
MHSMKSTHHIRHAFSLACAFLCLVVGSACEDSSVNTLTSNHLVDFGTYDVSAYMPLALGNQWIYHYEGFERAVLDRQILDSLRAPNGLLMYGYSEPVQTVLPDTLRAIEGYIGINGGTLYFAGNRSGLPGPMVPYLSTPIVVGRLWAASVSSVQDSFRIVSVQPELFNNQMIDTVVVVRRTHGTMIDSIAFARGVGLLRQSTSSDWGMFTRSLDSYSLAH